MEQKHHLKQEAKKMNIPKSQGNVVSIGLAEFGTVVAFDHPRNSFLVFWGGLLF